MAPERLMEGRHVLVVEDEMALVVLIEEILVGLGADIVGPVAWLDAALELARAAPIDAAVLDISIRGGNSYAVADILAERGIPFVFCTGYGDWALEPRHRDQPRLAKPFGAHDLTARVLELLRAPAG